MQPMRVEVVGERARCPWRPILRRLLSRAVWRLVECRRQERCSCKLGGGSGARRSARYPFVDETGRCSIYFAGVVREKANCAEVAPECACREAGPPHSRGPWARRGRLTWRPAATGQAHSCRAYAPGLPSGASAGLVTGLQAGAPACHAWLTHGILALHCWCTAVRRSPPLAAAGAASVWQRWAQEWNETSTDVQERAGANAQPHLSHSERVRQGPHLLVLLLNLQLLLAGRHSRC